VSVCLCVCMSVCLCVCVSVCLCEVVCVCAFYFDVFECVFSCVLNLFFMFVVVSMHCLLRFRFADAARFWPTSRDGYLHLHTDAHTHSRKLTRTHTRIPTRALIHTFICDQTPLILKCEEIDDANYTCVVCLFFCCCCVVLMLWLSSCCFCVCVGRATYIPCTARPSDRLLHPPR
jgi:hypothetical protein